jgi:hypothetical protein
MQISQVSQATFDALRGQLLSALQAEITGTTEGAITGHGVTANYHYDSVNQTLTVDVTHHPFFIPVSAIESQLRDAVAGCQKTNPSTK